MQDVPAKRPCGQDNDLGKNQRGCGCFNEKSESVVDLPAITWAVVFGKQLVDWVCVGYDFFDALKLVDRIPERHVDWSPRLDSDVSVVVLMCWLIGDSVEATY